MAEERICLDCGELFREEGIMIGGFHWCSVCREKHQRASNAAENEAREQLKRVYNNPYELERKVQEVKDTVLNNRIKQSKYSSGN